MDFYDLILHFFLNFCFDLEDSYEIVFDHIFKHLESCRKQSATLRVFDVRLGVWKSGQTKSFVFDVLQEKGGSHHAGDVGY